MGTDVDGTFGTWTADIQFDEASRTGQVRVAIDTTSLTLGSVTKQAKETEFFDVLTHPAAVFDAAIAPGAGKTDYVATGTLALRGLTLPLELPFTMTVTDGRAMMSGKTQINRQAYKMGPSYPDEASVGFMVRVAVEMTATRQD